MLQLRFSLPTHMSLIQNHETLASSSLSYNVRFHQTNTTPPMEAERLNALSALLADLTTREVELRGYL